MSRTIVSLLLVIALLMQSVAAVGGVPESPDQQHCAGHDMAQKDCVCCPDGALASMNCTAQCSVSQAPMVMIGPIRVTISSTGVAFVQRVFAGPTYLPLVPPPIT